MDVKFIFLPVLLQILLTIWAYIALAIAKGKAVKAGQVNEARRALYDDAWPESVLKVNNNIRNQFEVPVLFFVVILVIASAGTVTIFDHIVAWLFVLSRIVHAYIHMGSNVVAVRRKVFTFGVLMILLLTVSAAWSLLAG